MAGVSTERGDEKLNTELNLVPFIDLLSTLVLFLLVSAVWLQISAIPASVESKGKGKTVAETKDEDRLLIRLTAGGHRLTWPAGAFKGKEGLPSGIAKTAGGYDHDRLVEILKMVTKNRPLENAAVSADDSVPYGALVRTIDVVKVGGIPAVALSTD